MDQHMAKRAVFFATALNLLSKAAETNLTQLENEANKLSTDIQSYPLPVRGKQKYSYHMLDTHATQFIPDDAPTGFLPIRTTPNGNCFYNAVSLALIGNECLAVELRVRTALALLQLREIILIETSTMVSDLLKEQILLYTPFAQTDYSLPCTNPTKHQLAFVFENEVVSTLQNFSWAGMWQLQALSTALNISIWSIYPKLNMRIRNHFQRIVMPILPYEDSALDTIPILWSGNIEKGNVFRPNHFVPLIDSTCFQDNHECTSPASKNKNINQQKSTVSPTCTITDQKNIDITQTTLAPTKFQSEQTSKKRKSSCLAGNQDSKDQTDFKIKFNHNSEYKCKEFLPKHNCSSCRQLILAAKPNVQNINETKQYFCSLCHSYNKRSEESPIAFSNINPGIIPDALSNLNNTEINIISQVHPYMTLVKLPVGGQFAQTGQSINIPIPVQQICNELPLSANDTHIVVNSPKPGKLTHVIDRNKVLEALQWLIKHNHLYANVSIKACEVMDIPESDSSRDTIQNNTLKDVSLIPTDYTIPASQSPAKPFTNTNPPAKYTLPFITGKPVNTFQQPDVEELAFPSLYPFGLNGYNTAARNITLKQYFICRLTNLDARWSSMISYLFWALNIYEQHQLQSCISIALRLKSQSAQNLKVENILSNNYTQHTSEDFRFMKTMKGTSAYWKDQLYNLLAKMSMLGPPTFFVSLSSNDSNWTELYTFIHSNLTAEQIRNMSAADKAESLRKNPVKSAMYFSKRWESFLRTYILGPAAPLGKVIDYFSRTEFQNRGSPHIHAFFWIEGAPDMETLCGREKGADFIDTYISAKLPGENDPLHATVKKLQTHTHTHTCYKKRKNTQLCRFDFPRPVSAKTGIEISNISHTTGRFYKLERPQDSIWINPYNPSILSKWNANMDIQVVGCKNAAAAYVCTYVCKNEPESLKHALSSTINKIPNTASIRKKMSKMGNVFLTHRLISAQEAAYRLLNIPMVSSSRETIFINSSTPEKRYKILKPKKQLEELPIDSTDVFAQSIHEIYENRPNGHPFETMCLAHFATHYIVLKPTEKIAANSNLKRFKLLTTRTQYIREKQKTSCFRTYIPNVTKDPEAYFHAILCLFLPWRKHEDLKFPHTTYHDAYTQKQNILQKDALDKFQYTAKLETAVQHIRSLEHDAQNDILGPITPAFMTSQLDADLQLSEHITSNFALNDCEDVDEVPTGQQTDVFHDEDFKTFSQYLMTDAEYDSKLKGCTEEQKNVLHIIDDAINNGKLSTDPLHLFITGGAGTGKSFLLQILREHILRQNQNIFPNVIVAAPTGVAAFNINAWTLHHLLRLDVQHKNQAKYHPLSAKHLEKMRKLFRQVKVLIIDEISMVSIHTLLHIHKRLTEIKDTESDANVYFGNIHVIVFGDLFQLRPVYGTSIFNDHCDMPVVHLWRDLFWYYELETNIRQSGDHMYADLLNRIRDGSHTKQDLRTLLICKNKDKQETMSKQHIFPTRELCRSHNSCKLEQSSARGIRLYEIYAHDDPHNSDISDDETFCGGLPKQLCLCVNARVMLLRNINTSLGLVNGAQGNITKFHWPNEKDQEFIGQIPNAVEVLFDDPRVGAFFQESIHQPILIKPITVSFHNAQRVSVTRCQLPISVSYAVTVHKIQGLTLKSAAVDIGSSVFTAGQAYVALSRLQSLKGLTLLDIDPSSIYASQKVKSEVQRLRSERCILFRNSTAQ